MWTFAVAVIPAVVLIVYIMIRDKYEREPIGKILLAFFVGMLAIPLDLLLISIFNLDYLPYMFDSEVAVQIATAFFSAAIPEEFSKFVILFLLIWRSKNFNERMDGIVYAVCVSMGFATVENVLYVFEDPSCAWGRALFAVPGHFLFAVLMGFFLSLAKFSVKHKFRNWTMTLLAPILAHGIYDAILMVSDVASEGWASLLTIVFYVFIFLLWRIGLKRISQHVDSSPFRHWRSIKDNQLNDDDIADDQKIDNMKDFFDR
ncbi:MAG: PrsW family intramembrane metalloprotease [Bacteroidales bacterium]|nr:PrsW family intramembrane metalloprotease [Bacteroidales bacterium]